MIQMDLFLTRKKMGLVEARARIIQKFQVRSLVKAFIFISFIISSFSIFHWFVFSLGIWRCIFHNFIWGIGDYSLFIFQFFGSPPIFLASLFFHFNLNILKINDNTSIYSIKKLYMWYLSLKIKLLLINTKMCVLLIQIFLYLFILFNCNKLLGDSRKLFSMCRFPVISLADNMTNYDTYLFTFHYVYVLNFISG